ncbi:hypothetical protein [Salipaludibacillus daqingensis]|uniref:hypothetical protein n=1 Tax=Salipaludibacillus daqingensis TaxID=3041001 RepID=UPI0024753215|nr:hypothetical protein [Salipaludibacillus daqingensis]
MEEEKLIQNRKKFWVGVTLLLITTVIVLPFPHNKSLGESLLLAIGIPPFSNMENYSGFHFVGIGTFILIIISLTYIARSLSKWKGRIIILTIIFMSSFPPVIVDTIQSTVASGIYAISYESGRSQCLFELEGGETEAEIECSIFLENQQNKAIDFELVFQKTRYDDFETYARLNQEGPYYFTLSPRESRYFQFNRKVDMSGEEVYSMSGRTNHVEIILRDNQGNERRL